MRNRNTELVFILDRSGSMAGLEEDTIGGFNSMLRKNKNLHEGEAIVSTVLFDNVTEILHDRVPADMVPYMTDRDYYVRGCTALYDAVGGAIDHIADIHRYARPDDVPRNTMFVIMTDGMENASRYYNRAQIKRMIEHQRNRYGWEFVFISANIDAGETAESIGIGRDDAVDYIADKQGTRIAYEAATSRVEATRMGRPREDRTWRKKIDRDYRTRGKK